MTAMAASPQNIALGCARSERSRNARARYRALVFLLARRGYAHLLKPGIREAALFRLLDMIAAGVDPSTAGDEEIAVLNTIVRTPRSFSMFARRNRKWLDAQIAAATVRTTDS